MKVLGRVEQSSLQMSGNCEVLRKVLCIPWERSWHSDVGRADRDYSAPLPTSQPLNTYLILNYLICHQFVQKSRKSILREGI